MNRSMYILPAIALAVAAVLSSIFIVDEREKALVLQFGQIVQIKEEPGIGFRIPIIQDVVTYDARILALDMEPIVVTPLDDRPLIVDAFARYRIDNVEQFRQAVGVGGETRAAARLDGLINAKIYEILGTVTSSDILSTDRATLMLRIRDAAIVEANALGIAVIDVRLKRTDLLEDNLRATFAQMITEREREAEDERARGREAAERIQAQADRTQREIVSDASRQALVIKGEADAERNAIFAQAYGQDPEFFEFYRSLQAYGKAIGEGNTSLVLSPDHEFFNYLRNENGTPAGQ